MISTQEHKVSIRHNRSLASHVVVILVLLPLISKLLMLGHGGCFILGTRLLPLPSLEAGTWWFNF
jgi:hypothetical protein